MVFSFSSRLPDLTDWLSTYLNWHTRWLQTRQFVLSSVTFYFKIDLLATYILSGRMVRTRYIEWNVRAENGFAAARDKNDKRPKVQTNKEKEATEEKENVENDFHKQTEQNSRKKVTSGARGTNAVIIETFNGG